MPYFWAELKYAKWRDKPNSISLSIGTRDDSNEYHLSIRVDTRNISSHEEDLKIAAVITPSVRGQETRIPD